MCKNEESWGQIMGTGPGESLPPSVDNLAECVTKRLNEEVLSQPLSEIIDDEKNLDLNKLLLVAATADVDADGRILGRSLLFCVRNLKTSYM